MLTAAASRTTASLPLTWPLLIPVVFIVWVLAITLSPGIGSPGFSRPLAVAGALPSVFNADIALQRADGRQLNLASTAGTLRVVSMIYSHCPGLCPLTVQNLQALERQLNAQQRGELSFMLLSLDPTRDSPARLSEFAAREHVDTSQWLLARPGVADSARIAQSLGISTVMGTDVTIDHTPAIALVDRDGRVLASVADGNTLQPRFLEAVRQAATVLR
jgi:protein SCO1